MGVVKSITESEDVELDPELELFSKGIFSIGFFNVDSGTKTSSSDSEELFGFIYIVPLRLTRRRRKKHFLFFDLVPSSQQLEV